MNVLISQNADEDFSDDLIRVCGDTTEKKTTAVALEHGQEMNDISHGDAKNNLKIDNEQRPNPSKNTGSTSGYGRKSFVLPVTFFDNSRNIQLLSECKPFHIEVVDYKKYPWHFAKYSFKQYKPGPKSRKPCLNTSNILLQSKVVQEPNIIVLSDSEDDCDSPNKSIPTTSGKSSVNEKIPKKSVQLADLKSNTGLVGLKIVHKNCVTIKESKPQKPKGGKIPKTTKIYESGENKGQNKPTILVKKPQGVVQNEQIITYNLCRIEEKQKSDITCLVAPRYSENKSNTALKKQEESETIFTEGISDKTERGNLVYKTDEIITNLNTADTCAADVKLTSSQKTQSLPVDDRNVGPRKFPSLRVQTAKDINRTFEKKNGEAKDNKLQKSVYVSTSLGKPLFTPKLVHALPRAITMPNKPPVVCNKGGIKIRPFWYNLSQSKNGLANETKKTGLTLTPGIKQNSLAGNLSNALNSTTNVQTTANVIGPGFPSPYCQSNIPKQIPSLATCTYQPDVNPNLRDLTPNAQNQTMPTDSQSGLPCNQYFASNSFNQGYQIPAHRQNRSIYSTNTANTQNNWWVPPISSAVSIVPSAVAPVPQLPQPPPPPTPLPHARNLGTDYSALKYTKQNPKDSASVPHSRDFEKNIVNVAAESTKYKFKNSDRNTSQFLSKPAEKWIYKAKVVPVSSVANSTCDKNTLKLNGPNICKTQYKNPVHNGYSPPILPIPTVEKCLQIYSTCSNQNNEGDRKVKFVKHRDINKPEPKRRKSVHNVSQNDANNMHKKKKITLEDYKKRIN